MEDRVVCKRIRQRGVKSILQGLGAAIICFVVVAFYCVVKGGDKQIEALQYRTGLIPIIEGVRSSFSADENVILVIGSIRNTGAPSIAENFELHVSTANNGEIMTGNTTIYTGLKEWTTTLGVQLIDSFAESLQMKATTPIPQGGVVRGILFFRFPRPFQVGRGTLFKLNFTDVTGKKYEASYLVSGVSTTPADASPITYPGLGFPHFKN